MAKHYPKPPAAIWLEQWPNEIDTPDNVHYEQTGYGDDLRGNMSRITKYVRDTGLQARLDAIAKICDDLISLRGREAFRGTPSEDMFVLARGTPARELKAALKRYGRKEKTGG